MREWELLKLKWHKSRFGVPGIQYRLMTTHVLRNGGFFQIDKESDGYHVSVNAFYWDKRRTVTKTLRTAKAWAEKTYKEDKRKR